MSRLRIESIIWDLDEDPEGNVQHFALNDISKEEADEVLLNPDSSDDTSNSTGRPAKFGETSTGRYIMVVFEIVLEDPLTVYPVSGFEVSRPA